MMMGRRIRRETTAAANAGDVKYGGWAGSGVTAWGQGGGPGAGRSRSGAAARGPGCPPPPPPASRRAGRGATARESGRRRGGAWCGAAPSARARLAAMAGDRGETPPLLLCLAVAQWTWRRGREVGFGVRMRFPDAEPPSFLWATWQPSPCHQPQGQRDHKKAP